MTAWFRYVLVFMDVSVFLCSVVQYALCKECKLNSVSQSKCLQKTVKGLLCITITGCMLTEMNCVLQVKLRETKCWRKKWNGKKRIRKRNLEMCGNEFKFKEVPCGCVIKL